MTIGCRIPGKVFSTSESGRDLVLIGLGLGQFGIDLPLVEGQPAKQLDKLRIVAHADTPARWSAGHLVGEGRRLIRLARTGAGFDTDGSKMAQTLLRMTMEK
jgi:hypothetical protein